jgi:hypothetical protein
MTSPRTSGSTVAFFRGSLKRQNDSELSRSSGIRTTKVPIAHKAGLAQRGDADRLLRISLAMYIRVPCVYKKSGYKVREHTPSWR